MTSQDGKLVCWIPGCMINLYLIVEWARIGVLIVKQLPIVQHMNFNEKYG